MARWFKRWSSFDSARSLGEWLFWGTCLLFNTTGAAVVAATAAYTQWYWEAYGPVGVAFAFIFSGLALPLSGLIAAAAALIAASARNKWRNPQLVEPGTAQGEDIDLKIVEMSEEINRRIDELDAKTSVKIRQTEGNRHGDYKYNIDRLSESISYEAQSRKRDVDGIGVSISGIRNGLNDLRQDNFNLREQIRSILQAKLTLQAFSDVERDIEELALKMTSPTIGGDVYRNWSSWATDSNTLMSMLRHACAIAAPYLLVEKEVFSTPTEKYKSKNWSYGFPNMDDDQKHDYKTFRIIYSNFCEYKFKIRSKISSIASSIP